MFRVEQYLIFIMSEIWEQAISITYTVVWSLPMYGLLYENHKLKSVQGCELNYLYMNINGFVFYAIYCSIGYFLKAQGAGTVLIGDLLFSYHILIASFFVAYQTFIYPRGRNRLSIFSVALCCFLWVALMGEILLSEFFHVIPKSDFWNPVSFFGYGKLVLSVVKYTPPIYWNYKRQSTKGWSIFRTLTDLIGGLASLISGFISTTHGVNFTKIILATLTTFYNTIFVIQHYCLYRRPVHQEEIHQSHYQGSKLAKELENQQSLLTSQ